MPSLADAPSWAGSIASVVSAIAAYHIYALLERSSAERESRDNKAWSLRQKQDQEERERACRKPRRRPQKALRAADFHASLTF
jgi:hypothetical protein